jgi:hypothetical protein
MFGSLTKLADKAFVIGFVLPTLIASMTLLYLFNDIEPFKSAYKAALGIKQFNELTIAVLIMWSLACLLMIWNEWQYRFLEGYVGPFNNEFWRERTKRVMEDQRVALSEQAPILNDPKASAEDKQEHLKARREFFKRFPIRPELVLPTRFGNILRAFETYSYDVYGVEAIPGWLRLQGVIPKSYAALVNDARSAVDFFVNIWFLAAGIAILGFARMLWAIHVDVSGVSIVSVGLGKYAMVAVAGTLTTYIAYSCAIATAATWGDLVKGAFDLYLPALAKQMGYQLPKQDRARQVFWDEVNSLFLYRARIDTERWAAGETARTPAGASSAVRPEPQREDIEKENEDEGDDD